MDQRSNVYPIFSFISPIDQISTKHPIPMHILLSNLTQRKFSCCLIMTIEKDQVFVAAAKKKVVGKKNGITIHTKERREKKTKLLYQRWYNLIYFIR